MFDYEFPPYSQLGLFNEETQSDAEQGRFMVGYMKRGGPLELEHADSLYSANIPMSVSAGGRIVCFVFDRKNCCFTTVMWENEAVQSNWFNEEYKRFLDQCSSLLVGPNLANVLPKLTASKGQLDLSDPIQRGIYDGFIPRKAVAR